MNVADKNIMDGVPMNNKVVVLFDYNWNSGWVDQGNGFVVPERFIIEDGDADADAAYGVTTDRRLINPQKITVIQGNEYWIKTIKETYPEYERNLILKSTPLVVPGRYFVHYGAFEVATFIDEEHHALMPAKMILFGIDPIWCMPGTYLGEEVFGELPMTESGIYLTPQLEEKEGVLVRITHIPEDSKVSVGDIVVTVDQFQYELNYEGKKYLKVEDAEIIGVKTETGYLPMGNRVLVDYLPPDSELLATIAENDRRRKMRDYIDHNRMHVSEAYTKGIDPNYLDVPEPKFTHAMAVSTNNGEVAVGDKLLIHRNYGCRLPNGQWILSMDLILGVISE